MSTTWDPTTNDEQTEAWNGVLFDRFVQFRHLLTDGLGQHGEVALKVNPPQPGDRVLDIGCGFGDTAQRIAGMVGPEGSVLGVDVASRFIDFSRADAEANGVENVTFETMDVEKAEFEQIYDYAFSRFGVQFFTNPVPALRRVRAGLVPGGRFCAVVWRQKIDNPWLHKAELVTKKFVDEPDETDEPTCGPGPFAMAGADTTSDMLLGAGFEQIGFRRCDIPIKMGDDMDEAIALITALGPAGEAIRLAGERAEEVRPQIEAAVREVIAEYEGEDGVWGPASTWIVSAVNPG
ncbi:MAG: hypothetical protein QOG62_183 [Thermoleophilaceae bacterium]|jgi:SAM-dependent methyltransferase|nr:hypothetical protein [Thermoleophilaceae bacterium]